jgi:hypothetical protein
MNADALSYAIVAWAWLQLTRDYTYGRILASGSASWVASA